MGYKTGRREFKWAACNAVVNPIGEATIERSPQLTVCISDKTKNTTVSHPFPEHCAACPKRKNGEYPSVNSNNQLEAQKSI